LVHQLRIINVDERKLVTSALTKESRTTILTSCGDIPRMASSN